jgi:hypothetical protein
MTAATFSSAAGRSSGLFAGGPILLVAGHCAAPLGREGF